MELETTERREYVLRGYMDAILFTEERGTQCPSCEEMVFDFHIACPYCDHKKCFKTEAREFGTDLMTAINSDIDRFIGTIPTLSNFSIDQCERIGHDFWLTRNGHGAGFWDGDWDEDFEKLACDVCEEFGSFGISFDDSYIMDIG